MSYLEFTRFIVSSIIDNKEVLKIDESNDENGDLLINVYVDNADIGKVIGKQGKTAIAIRNVVQASFFQDYKKVKIDFHSYE